MNSFAFQGARLSMEIAVRAQARGGLLLHGALIEREGAGIILAGPGGAGKTLASQRLPPPWRSLSDDVALLVPDGEGGYWAHPWPTWSNFINGDSGGAWNVSYSVPLRGIFFISQNRTDRVKRIGEGEELCFLLESVEQASRLMSRGVPRATKRALHLQWLDNACSVVKSTPGYRLFLSRTGEFWCEIERALPSHITYDE